MWPLSSRGGGALKRELFCGFPNLSRTIWEELAKVTIKGNTALQTLQYRYMYCNYNS